MLKGKDLISIGYVPGKILGEAMKVANKMNLTDDITRLALLKDLLGNPSQFLNTEFSKIAQEMIPREVIDISVKLVDQKPYNIFGEPGIERGAMDQMDMAMRLPVAVAGSLMADAHQGYALPIGGVLALDNAISPYCVGVDIGCRMSLSIYDINPSYLDGMKNKIKNVLLNNTRFGAGCEFENPMDDEIFDNHLFNDLKIIRDLKYRAHKQIGTSGSGNHFVEFGEVLLQKQEFGLQPGNYIGILSHSGSRGLGARIAEHYSKIAIKECPLPKEAKNFAYLNLDSEAGQQYWLAMNLAGDYAKANHDQIHKRLSKALGWKHVAKIENHHNFAWKEIHNGKQVVVHRKGATPADNGVFGIIPGSMATPGFLVKGMGNVKSLYSASHGAGRTMSRTKALNTFTKSAWIKALKDNNVTLIGGNLDESPMAYKDITTVMEYQHDLVEIQGIFMPRIVRMDDANGGDI